MDDRVQRALEQDATIVTANRRLARSLRHEHNAIQQARGATAWKAPAILPWSSWIGTLWEELLYTVENPPVRLGAWQERVLWERIIRESPQAGELLQLNATAAVAREAWALARAWHLDLARAESLTHEDLRAFTSWASRFGEICAREGWLDEARVPDHVQHALGGLCLPKRVLLAGFDELTPQQQSFVEACRAVGCSVERVSLFEEQPAAKAVRVPCADREQEIVAAARWSRALLEQGVSRGIGVVVLDLTARRKLVERSFREVLEPGAQLPEAHAASQLINISAGATLASYPLVRSALAVLNLSPRGNAWSQLSALIRDSYLVGAESERTRRGLLDARLREVGGHEVSIDEVLRLCRDEACSCPALEGALEAWQQVRSQAPARQSAGQWARTFSALLEAMGWPGERSLDSHEHQTFEQWSDVLAQFVSTDLVGGAIAVGTATSLLGRIAADTMYQPKSEAEAPVQVLGVFEAAGLSFEHLWVAGLDDEAWPAPARPNPLLPLALQRAAGIPRCSPEGEMQFAGVLTKRLLASSADVVLSYPAYEGDQELAPSPLLHAVPSVALSTLQLWDGSTLAEVIRQSRSVEHVQDARGPALSKTTSQRGGTKVFQYQAACPFRAFAELRLGACELEAPTPGLDTRQRGILAHAVLEEFWQTVRTHEALVTRSDIPQVVRQAVQAALARLEHDRGRSLPERFAALERERLECLVTEWLAREKERPAFEVVQPEGERSAVVGGIRCRIKIDRIDRLADGRELIIDYKTGSPHIRDWETARPAEPQLPLYATVHEAQLAGVLFGEVRAGKTQFRGFVAPDIVVPGAVCRDLAAQLEGWRMVLERLGAEFYAGHAEVDPRDGHATCSRCPLSCLCRCAEVAGTEDEEELPA